MISSRSFSVTIAFVAITESQSIIRSPEYRELFLRKTEAVTQFVKVSLEKIAHEKLQGFNGYTPLQEALFVLSLGMVINPDLLSFSHCTHRAVAACMVQTHTKLPDEKLAEISHYMRSKSRSLLLFTTQNETAIVSYGTNNWLDTPPLVPADLVHDCKITPGTPLEVPRAHLPHLHLDSPMDNYPDIDNACPKRTRGAQCHVAHAERSVIESIDRMQQAVELPTPESSILACTWVPCTDCLALITTQKNLSGKNFDLYSVYAADDDDMTSAREIKAMLQPELNHFSGPYVQVPKQPGYGWWPARETSIETLKSQMYSAIGDEGIILRRALRLY